MRGTFSGGGGQKLLHLRDGLRERGLRNDAYNHTLLM